jgi:hypothetical protein
MMDVSEIEKRVDRAIAAPIPVDLEMGGVALENMGQVMEFAKLMAVSGAAVPKYLRGNPGACLAICSRALRWQMDPFAVAEKSYMVVNKGEERIAFEAQLVHAVVTARAPLKNRLRYEIIGEGDARKCRVWGTFRGETEPHSYLSETLAKLRDARGRNEYGNIKGSPLWDAQPEVQLAYSSVRQWARLFASETLLGVYTPDELEDGSKPVDVTPTKTELLAQRLREAKASHADGRGFDADHVSREAAARSSIIEGEVNTDDAEQKEASDERSENESAGGGRQGNPAGVGHDAGDQGAGGADVGAATDDGSKPSGQKVEVAQTGQADIFPPDRSGKAKPKGNPKR